MRIEATTPSAITRREAEILSNLTCDTGTMRSELAACRELKVGKVFIARHNGKVAGWLLLQGEDVSIFVRHDRRRKGVGTALMEAAREHSPVLRCWSNQGNAGFFQKVRDVRAENWMLRKPPVAV